jgi:DNA polymerase III alpha subunit (gram-positive type)
MKILRCCCHCLYDFLKFFASVHNLRYHESFSRAVYSHKMLAKTSQASKSMNKQNQKAIRFLIKTPSQLLLLWWFLSISTYFHYSTRILVVSSRLTLLSCRCLLFQKALDGKTFSIFIYHQAEVLVSCCKRKYGAMHDNP